MGIYLRDRDRAEARFDISTAEANLYLTDVSVIGTSQEAGLTIPILGIAIGPKHSRNKQKTSTDITQFSFNITLDEDADEQNLAKLCNKNKAKTQSHKLSNILLGYGKAVNRVQTGSPTFKSTQFILDTRFQVLKSTENELGIDFSIVELEAQKAKSQTNTQRLHIKFGVTGEVYFHYAPEDTQ